MKSNKNCEDCPSGGYCPKSCNSCLRYIHFPHELPNGAPQRHYDCHNMLDTYVCNFACKYASEIAYPLREISSLAAKKELNVLSIGCGPCTDLLAIDYLKQTGIFNYKALCYVGVDINKTWQCIHEDIKKYKSPETNLFFNYNDIRNLYNKISTSSKWVPDIIVFQYVLSDMQKFFQPKENEDFLQMMSNYINTKLLSGSIVLINDINLHNAQGGGRDYFDKLSLQVKDTCEIKRSFFQNRNQSIYSRYSYGDPWPSNNLIITYPQDIDWDNNKLSQSTTCSSAQMIITKR